ncbi:L,D-transpeptidase family protein [Francisella sp. Scap27]|uniref:L,D-transpeptidase family protein n=1 Tax=Francisella sp. Scap27 TaxID=2589986 RepID=UPI00356647B8
MSYFDKDKNNDWIIVKKNIDVVIGKKGLAPTESFEYSKLANKTEGDSKTPAGVFKIGKTFGFEDSDLSNYVQVKTGIECIDDSSSKYYNDIINTSKYTKDWQSSEHMVKVPQYKYGIELLYNHNPAEAKKGSCIFMHIWKSPSTGTEGCTAMAETDIKNLQSWIESSKNPVIVQLTSKSYEQVKAQWHLPNLS